MDAKAVSSSSDAKEISHEALADRGWVAFQQGSVDEAVKLLEQAVNLCGDNSSYHRRLVLLLLLLHLLFVSHPLIFFWTFFTSILSQIGERQSKNFLVSRTKIHSHLSSRNCRSKITTRSCCYCHDECCCQLCVGIHGQVSPWWEKTILCTIVPFVSIDYFHVFLLESKKGQILVAFWRCVHYGTS